jgi:DNA-binding NtrC family response regulator
MSGNTFLSQLTLQNLAIPVIVISANSHLLASFPQVKKVIQKPFGIDQVLTVVEEILQNP